MQRTYYVYLLASQRNGTLYVGVTNDIARRIFEHREGVNEGFTKKYRVTKLVYFEMFADIGQAISLGENNEGLAASVEDQQDRRGQSNLAGFVRRAQLVE